MSRSFHILFKVQISKDSLKFVTDKELVFFDREERLKLLRRIDRIRLGVFSFLEVCRSNPDSSKLAYYLVWRFLARMKGSAFRTHRFKVRGGKRAEVLAFLEELDSVLDLWNGCLLVNLYKGPSMTEALPEPRRFLPSPVHLNLLIDA